jgi:hypothetical protein
MVSLEWMMHIVGGIHCWWMEYCVAGGKIGLGYRPPLNSSHLQWLASAGLAWLLKMML